MSDKSEIGADGWPVSPDHPANRTDTPTIAERRKQFFAKRLAVFEKAWLEGKSPRALADTVRLCGHYDRSLPDWTTQALLDLLRAGKFPAGPGRLGNDKAADRQNRIHYERWSTIVEIRDRWDELPDLHGEGRFSLEKARAKAVEILAGTEAAGDEDAIKKSYQLVEKLFKNGDGAIFYV